MRADDAAPGHAAPDLPAPAGGEWRVETATAASRTAGAVALLLLLVAAAAPAFAPRAVLQDLFFVLTMLVLAQNWNLLAGYAGLVSIGQQAFVGVGAYAMFAAVALGGLDPVAALALGGVAAVALSVPTAWFVFRLQGAYFAIATWAVAEAVRLAASQWKALGGGTGTSLPRDAVRGMWGLDRIEALLGLRGAAARDVLAYWLALALAAATTGFVHALMRSRAGLALAAVRDNEGAAGAVGVDARRVKMLVYVAAAFGTGLAGALIHLQSARLSPESAFSVTSWTAYVVFIVVIGGIGTIEGPIVGVLVFFLLQNLLAQYGAWYLMVLGLIGIAVMLGAPRGVWGLVSDRYDLHLFPVRRRLSGGAGRG